MCERKALTLIETLTVLAILSILTTILTVTVLGVLQEQREVRVETELTLLLQAGQVFEQRFPNQSLNAMDELVHTGCLAKPLASPFGDFHYDISNESGHIRVQLHQDGAVYERGGYRAEKVA